MGARSLEVEVAVVKDARGTGLGISDEEAARVCRIAPSRTRDHESESLVLFLTIAVVGNC